MEVSDDSSEKINQLVSEGEQCLKLASKAFDISDVNQYWYIPK